MTHQWRQPVQYHLKLSEGHGGPSAMSTHPWSIDRAVWRSSQWSPPLVLRLSLRWPEVHHQKPLLQGKARLGKETVMPNTPESVAGWASPTIAITAYCFVSLCKSIAMPHYDSPYCVHSNACFGENLSDPSWDRSSLVPRLLIIAEEERRAWYPLFVHASHFSRIFWK